MNELTDLREKLLQRLRGISIENGYYTNAGQNVRAGWFEELIQTQKTTGPIIVLQRGKNGIPKLSAGELVLPVGYLVVAAVDSGMDGYGAELDNLEHDIYSALVKKGTRGIPWAPFGAYRMSFGEPLDAPPGGGQRMTSLAIPVTFEIIIQRHEAYNHG